MSLQKINQRGWLYEIPILIALAAIALAYLIPAVEKYGFAKGLLRTGIGIGIILCPFVALFLVFWTIGFISERFFQKKPKETEVPFPGTEKKDGPGDVK